MLPLFKRCLVLEHQSCHDDLHWLLLLLNVVFDMIGGLIMVSHAPKRWYSAGGFWGCDRLVSEPLVIEN